MWFSFSSSYLHRLFQIFLSSSSLSSSSPLMVFLYMTSSFSLDLSFPLPLCMNCVFAEFVGFCQICILVVSFCLLFCRGFWSSFSLWVFIFLSSLYSSYLYLHLVLHMITRRSSYIGLIILFYFYI